jgi:hypothetical protein
VCLHMHSPRELHLTALKRIIRYLRGSIDYGFLLRPSPTSELMVYTDADWAGCPNIASIHFRLCHVPRRQPRHRAAKHRGRVPCCGEWHGRGLLAALAFPRAPQPPPVRHSRLLQQRQCGLSLHQSRAASAHKAHVDQHALRLRACCHR